MIASEGHLFGWIAAGAALVEALGATVSESAKCRVHPHFW
jgi:hypothetical protein